MFTDDEFLPVSLIQHLLFCERRAALVHIERLWADNFFTMEGTIFHRKVDGDLPVESRGDVRVSRGLMLRSMELGMIGRADVVEFHLICDREKFDVDEPASGIRLENTAGLWRPFPVDYKRGRLRHEAGYEAQLCAQAICLEEMMGVAVPEGALFYGRTRRRKHVVFDKKLRQTTRQAAARLHELIASGKTPPAHYGKKCRDCSLADICMPKVAGAGKSATRYLSGVFKE